jgi:hypothetical protein
MSFSVNKILVGGTVTDDGIQRQYAESGTPDARWTLMVQEAGANGARTRDLFRARRGARPRKPSPSTWIQAMSS